jgi:hypothetical protein
VGALSLNVTLRYITTYDLFEVLILIRLKIQVFRDVTLLRRQILSCSLSKLREILPSGTE